VSTTASRAGVLARIAALLGISAFASRPQASTLTLGDPDVDRTREAFGGQIQMAPQSLTRWYVRDLETALRQADAVEIQLAAQLMRAAHSDGVYSGVMSTRTDGLVRLPKRFRGEQEQIDALQLGGDKASSIFDEMFPPAELALLARDGIELGVGVAELVPVEGRDYPVMVRLDPEFLVYRWAENTWYFRSIAGLLKIEPGNGRWILHIPGGRNAPWHNGCWRATGGAYIRKSHANLHKDNYEATLAHPARVATSPQGATEEQRVGWFKKLAGWGQNSTFGMPSGFDAKILESNGRGFDCFLKTIADQNGEYMIVIAGQTVSTQGGTGVEGDIFSSIRADLIKATADGLAYTINTQGIPPFILARWDERALDNRAVVEWDVTPPQGRNAEATAMVSTGNAIKTLTEALALAQSSGLELDVAAMCTKLGIPVRKVAAPANGNATPTLALAPPAAEQKEAA